MNLRTRLTAAVILMTALGAGFFGCSHPSPPPLSPVSVPTSTPTSTSLSTVTATTTQTPTSTPTLTPAATLTSSPTSTASSTPSLTATQTPTPTASSTPSSTPTPTTGCTSSGTFGDMAPSTSVIALNIGSTYAQYYTLSQGSTVTSISLDPSSSVVVQVGIYSDMSGLLPNTVLYQSSSTALSAGLSSVSVPNVILPAGSYWLAFEAVSGTPDFYAASGSTAANANMTTPFPSPWFVCVTGIPNPTPTPTCTIPIHTYTNQVVLYAGYCD